MDVPDASCRRRARETGGCTCFGSVRRRRRRPEGAVLAVVAASGTHMLRHPFCGSGRERRIAAALGCAGKAMFPFPQAQGSICQGPLSVVSSVSSRLLSSPVRGWDPHRREPETGKSRESQGAGCAYRESKGRGGGRTPTCKSASGCILRSAASKENGVDAAGIRLSRRRSEGGRSRCLQNAGQEGQEGPDSLSLPMLMQGRSA